MEQQNGERLVAMPCAFILFAAKKEGKKQLTWISCDERWCSDAYLIRCLDVIGSWLNYYHQQY